MSLLKKLAGETAIYGISSILSRLLNFVILTPYFTRVFLQGEYGVVSDLYTWVALLMILFTYRMETAFFRFGSKEGALENTFSTASISLLVSTLAFAGTMLIFAPLIASWLRYPDHPEYVILFTSIIALDALAAIPFARLRLQNRPIVFAVVKTGSIIVNILFIFFFLEGCPYLIERGWEGLTFIYNPENRIAYVFVSNMLGSLFAILVLLPAYFKLKLKFDAALWKRMLIYAWPLIIAGFAGIINQLIGIPMIKELTSSDIDYNLRQAGIYSAAAKLAVLMNLFTQAFNYAAEPFFFRNASREDSSYIYAQVGQAFAFVGSFAFLGIMLYIDIIQFFLGDDFREGLGVVPILLIAYLFLGLFYNFSIWYKLADRTKIGGLIALVGSIITISMNYFLIPNPAIGYYGPAWAALACYSFMALTSYWTGQRFYPIHYPMGRIFLYIGIAVGIYLISLQLQVVYADNLVTKLTVNTVLLLVFLGGIALIERPIVRRLLKR